MTRRLIGLVAALAVTVGGSLAVAAPAQAATPAIEITKVYYDSPGVDNRSKASLNAEYVKLTNRRARTINLKNWTLRDKANHVYTFSGNVKLAKGKSIVIRTGKGKNTASTRYWGSGNYIWNNTGDTAYLRNASGKLIDKCAWTKKGKGHTNC
ncbi:lamin tail domain-containing protein [Micromonospora sp. WMMD1082]|uniref:lamin tail domain-containing protein n=1 Tax=Micromonospora sp. WMMD1082 TaxID=3016104 RepID=UPI002415ED65|nr:lamin tail domain-containing protein [Micromonospora sp. WMMD1082]MDG4794426.1 lamin tail domain-containing protein [Micromonospora sp. WMMD1082]